MNQKTAPNQAKRIKRMTKRLQAEFPKAFKDGYSGWKPLAIGIKQQIIERLALTDAEEIETLGATLAKHVHRKPYLMAASKGLARIDLDGKPVGKVKYADREKAAEELAYMVALQAKAARAKAEATTVLRKRPARKIAKP